MTILYYIAACFLFCIINGEIDAWKTKRATRDPTKKGPNHPANAGFYAALITGCALVEGMLNGFNWRLLALVVCLLTERCLVFDQYLNVRRFGWKGFTYQPENPKSGIDRIENVIFGHKRAWAWSNAVYLVVLVVFVVGLIISI